MRAFVNSAFFILILQTGPANLAPSTRAYPTDLLHATFSTIVYNDQTVGTNPNMTGIPEVYTRFLHGWKVHSINYDEAKGKYYGVIFVNAENSQLVLAHRGTTFDSWGDLLTANSALGADIYGVLEGQFVGQEDAAALLTENAVNIAKQENYVFSTTGHSLGEWLAVISLHHSLKKCNYNQGKAVLFDSPGSGKTLNRLASRIL